MRAFGKAFDGAGGGRWATGGGRRADTLCQPFCPFVRLTPRNLSGELFLADLDLLQGTLDTLVLKTLSWGPRHGYAVAQWIKANSDGTINVEDRALYVALHRLEERRLVESKWGLSENK